MGVELLIRPSQKDTMAADLVELVLFPPVVSGVAKDLHELITRSERDPKTNVSLEKIVFGSNKWG